MGSNLPRKPKPTDEVTNYMDKLGFKPEVAMRLEFYNHLCSFHRDSKHPYRRSLNTKVSDHQVNQEIISFMHNYGDYYFGVMDRGHLFDDARTYTKGLSDTRILDDFPAVKSAFLSLSRSYNRQQRQSQKSRKRHSEDPLESSSECSRTTSQSPNGDSPYAPSEKPSSERSERISSHHGSKSNASRWNRSPTPVQTSERRSKSYRSSTHGSHAAGKSATVSDTASGKHRRRTTSDRATNQAAPTEPWDASSNAVDRDQVQGKMDGHTNGHHNDRYPIRARAQSNSANTSEQPTRKRGYQDNSDKETHTKSMDGPGPRSTVHDKKRHRSYDAPPQRPDFEIHFCAQNNRGAFQKWYQGPLKLLNVDSFFEHFYKSCGLKGHLTSITFTWNDAVPKRAWEVEAGDAKEFEAFKNQTRRILAEGKYVGIFHIDMEPILEMGENDVGNTIVVDI